MTHFNFPEKFHAIYDKALRQYTAGQRGPSSYFNVDEQAFLAANGLTPQNVYDYAEDHHNYSEPGYDQALAIELVRRDYFLNVQLGRPSGTVLDADTLPAKTEAVQGIEWLPRIIPKAKAKLRGELPSSLMYCCGGDRRFFTTHDILPSEFLTLVWRSMQDDPAITRSIADQAGASRIPAHMIETLNKVTQVQKQLLKESGREPTPEAVANQINLPVERVQQIMKMAPQSVTLRGDQAIIHWVLSRIGQTK